ncbi:MAG: 50S ribosomal protein L29 [Deltaproteobacteria bacterium]|nr:50S ribosomal protein L29 [Deltaproteobacteria bacterium]
MKMEELRGQSTEDLESLETSLGRDLFDARIKNYTNQLDDTSKMRKLRRDIARVKTLLASRRATPSSEEKG